MPLFFSSAAGLFLLFFGFPVGIALIAIPLVFLLVDPSITVPLLVIPQKMFSAMDSFPLMAVPFFVLVGQVMNVGGITNRIFDFANALIGHVKGGLAQVNILASLLMSGMSGSAVADASGLGQVEIKVEVKLPLSLDSLSICLSCNPSDPLRMFLSFFIILMVIMIPVVTTNGLDFY